MRRGMAVSTGDRHAGLSQPQFWCDHMHNALTAGTDVVKGNAVFLTAFF